MRKIALLFLIFFCAFGLSPTFGADGDPVYQGDDVEFGTGLFTSLEAADIIVSEGETNKTTLSQTGIDFSITNNTTNGDIDLVPNGTGTVDVSTGLTVNGGASTGIIVGSTTIAGNPGLTANKATPAANGVIFEGTTADAFEGLLKWDVTVSDKTLSLQNVTGTVYSSGGTDVPVADGGTGASTLIDGGVLLGSGTGAVTPMAVLTDGQMIVGDGTDDPVAESGATLRTSIGVGTGDSPQFTTTDLTGVTDGNVPYMAAAAAGLADSPLSTNGTNVDVKSTLTVIPDSTNEVFQVNDGTLDFRDGNGGTPGVMTINSSGDIDYSKAHAATSYTTDPTSEPYASFTDSDGDDNDVSGKIYNNLTATGTGAEIGDLYLQVMGGAGTAGTLQTFMHFDGSEELLTITGDVTVTGEVVDAHYENDFIPASEMTANATEGATYITIEESTDDTTYGYYAFNNITEEYVEFDYVMPDGWDLSTIKAKFYWKGAVGADDAETCEWEISGYAIGDSEPVDITAAGSQVISDTVATGTDTDLFITGATSALTIQGTPALGKLVHFKISRNVGGTDDMDDDALLKGVGLQFKITNTVPIW